MDFQKETKLIANQRGKHIKTVKKHEKTNNIQVLNNINKQTRLIESILNHTN